MFRPAILVVVALFALVAAGFGVRQYAPHYLPDQFTTDAVLAERMAARIMEDPSAAAFYTKFEALFPIDHAEFVNQLVLLQRRGGTQQQAMVLGQSYMTSFIEDNQRHAAAADPAALIALGEALGEGMRALGREDPNLCALYLRNGNVPPQLLMNLSTETKQTFMGVTSALLDAMHSGKTNPAQYAAPSEAQWLAWLARYEALGGDQRVLEAFNTPAQMRSMPAAEVCRAADVMWSAVLSAEDDFAPRFVSYSMTAG